MEFGISSLLLERKASLSEYTDAVVQRPDVQEMIRRVNFYVDPEAEQAGFDKMTSILKVHMKDGRVLTGRAQFAKGSPANPMSYDEVADKFRGCAEFAKWPRQKAEAVIEFVKTLESVPDVGRLTAMLLKR
jgi:2-methylcitrate dehydratase PrpD